MKFTIENGSRWLHCGYLLVLVNGKSMFLLRQSINAKRGSKVFKSSGKIGLQETVLQNTLFPCSG